MDGDRLTLTGEIDSLAVAAFDDAHPQLPVIQDVDVSGVTFMGSLGVALLVRLTQGAAPSRLRLHNPGRAVHRPLQLVGLASLMDMVDTFS